jgi:hypothetical protein
MEHGNLRASMLHGNLQLTVSKWSLNVCTHTIYASEEMLKLLAGGQVQTQALWVWITSAYGTCCLPGLVEVKHSESRSSAGQEHTPVYLQPLPQKPTFETPILLQLDLLTPVWGPAQNPGTPL